MCKGSKQQPAVEGFPFKDPTGELQRVLLLQKRELLQRPDIAPFIFALIPLPVALLSSLPYVNIFAAVVVFVYVVLQIFRFQWQLAKVKLEYQKCNSIEKATHAYVTAVYVGGQRSICLPILRQRYVSADGQIQSCIWFEYGKRHFWLDQDENYKQCFIKLEQLDDKPLPFYNQWGGYTTLGAAREAMDKWGPNRIVVPMPPFLELFKDQVMQPFFWFQCFCVLLWCLDEYWVYPLMTLGMLLLFESTLVRSRMMQLKELRSLQPKLEKFRVYRQNKWIDCLSSSLLPGDIVHVNAFTSNSLVVPADMVLLTGSCIIDEALLTGESNLQKKSPIKPPDAYGPNPDNLQLDKHHNQILFAGTIVSQFTDPETTTTKHPGVVAVVLRTGYETSQGQLLRKLLYTSQRMSVNSFESAIFILFLLIFALAASGYVLYHGLQEPDRDLFKLYLNCTMIITSVIPPELPMELSIAVNASILALSKKAVYCTEPFRIPAAGKIDVCCFDKTGTITSSDLLFMGVANGPMQSQKSLDGKDERQLTTSSQLTQEQLRVLATCHGLSLVNGHVLGDPEEKVAFIAIGASFLQSGSIKCGACAWSVINTHAFESALKRMSVVVQETGSGLFVVTKGAPEVLHSRLTNPPTWYTATYKQLAQEGSRVLALAYKPLKSESVSSARRMARENVESGLTFVGFAVYEAPLKPDSEDTLATLALTDHQLAMITGDNVLTACHVAQQVRIVTQPPRILTYVGHTEFALSRLANMTDSEFEWRSPSEDDKIPFSRDQDEIAGLLEQFDLCVTGDCLAHVDLVIPELVPAIKVFARTSPRQKEEIIKRFRAAGCGVLMCGDGTNDVGALMTSHVGVALLATQPKAVKESPGPTAMERLQKSNQQQLSAGERMELINEVLAEDQGLAVKPGDACLAAPFTARAGTIKACVDVLIQGRCTLVTTLQMFKVLGLQCLVSAYCLSVMYLAGIKMGEYQAVFMALTTTALFFFVSNTKPNEYLSRQRPHAHILSPYLLFTVSIQFVVHLALLIYLDREARAASGEDAVLDYKQEFKPCLINTVAYLFNNFVSVTTFAVNYVGEPFTQSLQRNTPFVRSVVFPVLANMLLLAEVVPFVNEQLQLVTIPQDLQLKVFLACVADFGLTYGTEQAMRLVFPARKPRLIRASNFKTLNIKNKKYQ